MAEWSCSGLQSRLRRFDSGFSLQIEDNMKIIVTGSSGFIGYHLSKKLLNLGHKIFGVDNMNSYYDTNLKIDRLNNLTNAHFQFNNIDISNDKEILDFIFNTKPDLIINLAAQAGVRYSLENPKSYIDSNISGFANILEAAKKSGVKNVIYASSSSVYGNSKEIPFCEKSLKLNPISLYAASKLSNELIAGSYSYNFDMNLIGLRFFTVYGPLGRPDMAYFGFTEKISKNEQITIYNKGKMSRDMTFIDDIVEGILKSIEFITNSNKPHNTIFNLGNNNPVTVWDLLNHISQDLKTDINYIFQDLNTEVDITYANISKAKELLKWEPKTSFEDGMNDFLNWYKGYKKL
jgi:UDP-glucuronate 4-epimerase